MKKRKELLVLLVMMMVGIVSLTYRGTVHAETSGDSLSPQVISISDDNGKIISQKVKGDINYDGILNKADLDLFNNQYMNTNVTDISDVLDFNNDGLISNIDLSLFLGVYGENKNWVLPNDKFAFQVIDKPKDGYFIEEVNISAGGNQIILTKDNPVSGNYKLIENRDRTWTCTGLTLNGASEISFTHQAYVFPQVQSNSDDNGKIISQKVKGDINYDGFINYADLDLFSDQYLNTNTTYFSDVVDFDNDGLIDIIDLNKFLKPFRYDGNFDLPNDDFTFQIIDEPKEGYFVESVKVTVFGKDIVLTKDSSTSLDGNYRLDENKDGTWTLSGMTSNGLNNVHFIHKQREKHSVTFYNYNNTVLEIVEIMDGTSVSVPKIPTREGYDFGGWYTDKNYTSKFDFKSAITSDISLYSKWIMKSVPDTPTQPEEPNIPEKPIKPSTPDKPVISPTPPSVIPTPPNSELPVGNTVNNSGTTTQNSSQNSVQTTNGVETLPSEDLTANQDITNSQASVNDVLNTDKPLSNPEYGAASENFVLWPWLLILLMIEFLCGVVLYKKGRDYERGLK